MEGKVAVKDLLQVEDKPRHTLDNIIDAPQKTEKPSRKHIISFHDLLYIPTSMYYVFEELYNLCCQLGSTLLSLNLSNSEHPHKIKEQPSTLMGLLRIKLDEVKKENRNLRAMLNQITQHYAVLKNRLLLTMQQQQQSSLPRNYHGLQEKYWIMHYHFNGESMDKRQLRVTLDLGLTTVATWELCPVRKKVERCAKDETAVTTSYEGNHNHAIPPPPDPWPPQRQQH